MSPSRRRHGPKNQQGTLAAAFPPLARLLDRRTASVRWCSRVLGSSFYPLLGKAIRATSRDPRPATKRSCWAFRRAVSSALAPKFRWYPAFRVLLPLPPLDDQPSWYARPRFRGPLAAPGRLERAAGRPETVVALPSPLESRTNNRALRHKCRWTTRRAHQHPRR